MGNRNNQKSLSEIFRELEKDKEKQVQAYEDIKKAQKEASFMFHVKHRTKKDNAILVLVVLIVLFTFSLFSRNYIFAVNVDDNPKKVIGTFEENDEPIDIYDIISKNISVSEQKEIEEIEENIEFETQYTYNKDIPDGETKTIQDGVAGKKIVTYVKSYKNNEMTEQTSIGERIVQDVQNQILEVGTSKVLKEYNIHIGDKLYVSQDIELKKNISENSESLLTVPKYYDVKALEVVDEAWIKVSYDDKNIGYILTNYLTSETLTPGILEVSRKSKILNKVNIDMPLNEPSGLSLEDYKTIFANKSQDTNSVFKNNYKMFYDAEQKYGINGVFLASIAIHESGWGRSSISVNKFNLYGFGAYDETPYESAVTFENYASGTDAVAEWLVSNYLNPAGTSLKTGAVASRKILQWCKCCRC